MKLYLLALLISISAFAAVKYDVKLKSKGVFGDALKAPAVCKCDDNGKLTGCSDKLYECVLKK